MTSKTVFSERKARKVCRMTIIAVAFLCLAWSAGGQVPKGSSSEPVAGAQTKKLTPEQMKEALRTTRAGHSKSSPRIANPHAASKAQNSSIIAALRNQKVSADAERTAILSAHAMTVASARGSGAPQGAVGTRGADGTQPPCSRGTVRDPLTGQCMPPCPPGTKSTAARPCTPVSDPPQNPPCPPGSMRDPVTGQCVSPPCPPGVKTTPAGQPCTPVSNPPQNPPCPPGSTVNPLTGQCAPTPCPPGATSTAARPCTPTGPSPTPTPGKPGKPSGSNPAGGSVQLASPANTQVNPQPTAAPGKGSTVAIVPASTAPPPTPRYGGSSSIAMPCAMQKTTIGRVNGQVKGVVFTPDPNYNLYTIIGCNFGDTQGQGHLNGPFAHGQVQLQIEFWTDTQIVAKVDPMISGEQDHDNVSLVIAPVSGPQVQAPGFKFYAAREEVELTKIPQNAVTFAAMKDNNGHPVIPEYTTPADVFPGVTAGVIRSVGDSAFGAGQDYYDFSGLAPGFTTSNMQLQHSEWNTSDCYSGGTLYENKNFSAAWDGDNVRANFGYFHCHAPSVLSVGGEEIAFSRYGLSVWVVGPRGVNPWSK